MPMSRSSVVTMVRSAQSSNGRSLEHSHTTTPNYQTAWKRGHASRGSVGEKIQVIPGFKTGSAFLTSLGANLRISDDDLLPSPTNTPTLRATPDFSHFLPPLPLAPTSMPSNDVDDEGSDHELQQTSQDELFKDVPPLVTLVATETEDKVTALKLIADSVAQQRQVASSILIFHPLNIAAFVLFYAVVFQFLYKSRDDLPLMFTTSCGLVMSALMAVKILTGKYLELAEDINWNWLNDDQILITKYGDDLIGACVLGWEKGEGRGNKRKTWGKGVVRALTVRLRYRGKGVGSALLEEAVKVVQQKGGDEVVFDDEHAHAKRVLKPIYNVSFEKKEEKYRSRLQGIAEKASLGKKR